MRLLASVVLRASSLLLAAAGAACSNAEPLLTVPVRVGTASVAEPPAQVEERPARAVEAEAEPEGGPSSVEVPQDPTWRGRSPWVGDLRGSGGARVAEAHRAKDETVKALFEAADVAFPPAELLFRVFKQERELEVWAAGEAKGRMARVATYEICAMSGGPGPKRREGDLQVPEGFYRIAYFWPDSAFYLAANVGYPNASDRVLGGSRPGSDIMIHGGCASIGCMAMTDERIQELFVMGTAVHYRGKPVHVHIFPARDLGPLLADPAHARHHTFWRDLSPALDLFAADARLPRVSIQPDGRYVVGPAT